MLRTNWNGYGHEGTFDAQQMRPKVADGMVTTTMTKFEPTLTLEEVRQGMAAFVAERDWNQFHTPRNLLLALTGEVGELCEVFQWKGESPTVDGWPEEERVHLGEELSDVLLYLVRLADQCDVDFPAALSDKIVKNGIKYPLKPSANDGAEAASDAAESTIAPAAQSSTSTTPSRFEPTLTLEALRKRVADFSEARGWNEAHVPRNLLLALTGELGELCEIFQWKGECKTVEDWPAEEKIHLGEELSDVMIYLVRLADKCNVDLPTAIKDKMVKNANKYPAKLVKGSSKKYSQYKNASNAAI